MPGTKWVTGDVITFARMNQKTLIVQAAEPAIMYPAMMWQDTDDDVAVCHVPNQNLDKAHVISISSRALDAHLENNKDDCVSSAGDCSCLTE